MSSWKTIRLVDEEPTLVSVVLNRPERRNAINSEMARELIDCIEQLGSRKELRAVVMTGEGSSFCSGGDLKEREELAPEETRLHRESVLRVVDAMEAFPVPIIGMINGPAVAGGLELALACDIRVASETATFALTEVQNVGSFPGAGGPVRLPKLVGRGHANYIVMTGRFLSAQQALVYGLVELVVPPEELKEEAYAVAKQIARNSPLGVSAAKKLMFHANDLDVRAATDLSRKLRDPLDHTHDYREGIYAWVAGRAPSFQGK